MATIPGINERAPQRPVFVNQLDELVKGQGLSEKSVHLAKEVAALLGSEASVRITNKSAGIQNAQVGVPNGPTGVPALDSPDDAKAKEINLERLISYLQLETDKHQAELAKDRIELQKDELEARHKDQKEKLQTSLDEMSKASASSKFMKVFGWIMAAAAVALAVVASVATGGLAIGPMVAAAVAIGMAVMNETGAMEAMTEGLASFLENTVGMSKMAAQIVAAVTVAAVMIALSVGAGCGASAIQGAVSVGAQVGTTVAASTSSLQAAAQSMQGGLDVGVKLMGLSTIGLGGYASYRGYEAGHAQADVSEADKFLAMMRQQMDESQEELQQILEQIQNTYSNIVTILDSETETQEEIAQKIGSMA